MLVLRCFLPDLPLQIVRRLGSVLQSRERLLVEFNRRSFVDAPVVESNWFLTNFQEHLDGGSCWPASFAEATILEQVAKFGVPIESRLMLLARCGRVPDLRPHVDLFQRHSSEWVGA